MDPEDIDDRSSTPHQTRSVATGACCNGAGDGTGHLSHVYALGRIEPRFPYPSVEKELAQAIGRATTAGLTDPQALHTTLSERQNRYLVRQLCWVLTIEGLETYLLKPRDPVDYDLLVAAIRPAPSPLDIDAVIGVRGPIAPPELCNGLTVPIVFFDQIYSFDREALIDSIPRPDQTTVEQFNGTAAQILDGIMQLADNAGATDEHRALNYLALRYSAIYHKVMEQFQKDFSLQGVETQPSRLSGTRKIVDAIFTFNHRHTDFVEKFFVRVDVTEEFPFLVTKLSPYFNR